MKEIWRMVVNHPSYQVSNLGNVRSIDRTILQAARSGRVYARNLTGQILSPGATRGGYHMVNLAGEARRVCRLVAKAFCSGNGPVVRHKNGIVTDDRASNLQWGTQGDNNRDAVKHGTFVSDKRLKHLRSIAKLGGAACRAN